MPTAFRLTHKGSTADVDIEMFRAMLPREIAVESRSDGLYAVVAVIESEDASTQPLVERELDRLFFLTCVRLGAEMCRRTVSADATFRYRVHGRIPAGTVPLTWTDELALQFKLWAIAADASDPMVKALLLFQIVELSYPDTSNKIDYPPYTDETKPPSRRTEAKLLRHLVAHAGHAKTETAKYLRFLGLPARLSNFTHRDWIKTLTDRMPIVEMEARELLQGAAQPVAQVKVKR